MATLSQRFQILFSSSTGHFQKLFSCLWLDKKEKKKKEAETMQDNQR